MSYTGKFRLGAVFVGLYRSGVFVRNITVTGNFITAKIMDATGAIAQTKIMPACVDGDSNPYRPILDGTTQAYFPDGRVRWVRTGLDAIAANMVDYQTAGTHQYSKKYPNALLALGAAYMASGGGGGRGGGGGGGGGDRAAWGNPASGGNGFPGNRGGRTFLMKPAMAMNTECAYSDHGTITVGAGGVGGAGGTGGARGNNADPLRGGTNGTAGKPGTPGGASSISCGDWTEVEDTTLNAYETTFGSYGDYGRGGAADTATSAASYGGNVAVRVGPDTATPPDGATSVHMGGCPCFSTSGDWETITVATAMANGGTAGSGGLSGEDDTLYVSNKEPTAGSAGGKGQDGTAGVVRAEIIEWNILS